MPTTPLFVIYCLRIGTNQTLQPLRVHKGWFTYSSQLFAPLEEQLQRHPEVTRLVLTGHSMGGALSTILGGWAAGVGACRGVVVDR